MASTEVKKEEPVSPNPISSDEEDIYEDAGDLEFYDKSQGNNNENLYSARLPDYLWKRWAALTERMGDDEEIRLGTLRTWSPRDANGAQTGETKLRMLLNDALPEHQAAPKEYDLELQDNNVKNTFLFSEKDLPRFAAREKRRKEAMAMDLPQHMVNRARDGRIEKKPTKGFKFNSNYQQNVPKKTKLVGKIHYELRVEPKDKAEEDKMIMQQLRDMEHPHSAVRILSRNKASAISNIGTTNNQQFHGFIKDAANVKKPKKGEATKNARIPRNQLMDLIFAAFREYQYWSMKALRQRTQQPDAYLRQNLEDVAVLNKTGKFANTYSLTDAYLDNTTVDAKVEAADEDDEDDDDEDIKMEDVI